VSYAGEWIGAPVVIGVAVFLCVPRFALLGLAFVVVIAAGVLVALVGASVAAPYLLARHVRRRWLSRGIDGRGAWAPVDRVLELFKPGRLSATELRVLARTARAP
jgi:hypothetical protein